MNDASDRPSFADILHPVTPEEFFAVYFDRKPLHIRGTPEKFAAIMSWRGLNDMLNMTGIWSAASMQMVLDTQMIAPARYCQPATGRDGGQILRPDPAAVIALLRQGASLVCNDIDGLSPQLAGVAAALEEATGAKVQANLYCSWRQRQAFASHFDTHDVFAIHVEGEKAWRVYEGRLDNPIAHPRFRSFAQDYHDRAKGKVLMEPVMRPGDLLYLPRGQYHDALASSGGTVHIAFGATSPIGMDFVSLLYEVAVQDSAFRANMPRIGQPDGDRLARDHLRRLAARLADIGVQERTAEEFIRFQRFYRYARGGFFLPEQVVGGPRYRRVGDGRLVPSGGGWGLELGGRVTPLPAGTEGIVGWIVGRTEFSAAELAAAFPAQPTECERLLRELIALKAVVPL